MSQVDGLENGFFLIDSTSTDEGREIHPKALNGMSLWMKSDPNNNVIKYA